MGSDKTNSDSKEDEFPQHKVKVSGFWISETEITWDQYEIFVFRNKDKEKMSSEAKLKELGISGVTGATTPYVDMSFGMGKENYPAINITRYAAIMYCKWLSAQTGEFYRLPTEAEWEYACKSGRDNSIPLKDVAFFGEMAYERVASLKPDKNGLYDMLGNVSEWTLDQYSPDFYKKSPENNPWLKPELLYPGVTRGGNWKMKEEDARCESRLPSEPRWKRRDPQLPKSRWWLTNAPFVGFRIVKPFEQPSAKEIEKYWLEVMEDYGE